MVENDFSKPTPLEIYELIRSKYTHEDLWTQQRVGWLLTANGFLFAGYGALVGLSSTATKVPGSATTVVRLSLILISLVGVVLPVLVGLGVYAAHFSKESAKREWSNLVSDEIRQLFPKIDAATGRKWLGSLASGGLCTFLVGIWVAILIMTIYKI